MRRKPLNFGMPDARNARLEYVYPVPLELVFRGLDRFAVQSVAYLVQRGRIT